MPSCKVGAADLGLPSALGVIRAGPLSTVYTDIDVDVSGLTTIDVVGAGDTSVLFTIRNSGSPVDQMSLNKTGLGVGAAAVTARLYSYVSDTANVTGYTGTRAAYFQRALDDNGNGLTIGTYGTLSELAMTMSGAGSADIYATHAQLNHTDTGNHVGRVGSISGRYVKQGAASLTQVTGIYSLLELQDGIVSESNGYVSRIQVTDGTTVTWTGYRTEAPVITGTGSINTVYGFYIEDISNPSVGQAYGLYVTGANVKNHFVGRVHSGEGFSTTRNTDWNAPITDTTLKLYQAITNNPTNNLGNSYYGLFIPHGSLTTYGMQIAGSVDEFWFRSLQAGSWNTWYKIWHGGNDGSGSGLDADLLDGQEGVYYRTTSNHIESGNLFYTNARARAAISGSSPINYDSGTGIVSFSGSYAGQTSITTLGTIGTGTWQGNTISTTYTAAKVTAVTNGTGIAVSPTTGSVTVSLSHLGLQGLTAPGADRIAFYDQTTGSFEWLTVGSNLTITGTTIDAASSTVYTQGTGINISGTVISLSFSNLQNLNSGGSDAILFWDTSASQFKQLTIGSGLTITDTTLSSTAGTGSMDDWVVANSGGGSEFTVTNGEPVQFVGSGSVSVSFGTSPQRITISGTDTTYSQGLGIQITGTVIALSHLGLQGLSDPNADRLLGWNNNTNATAWFSPGSGIDFTASAITNTDKGSSQSIFKSIQDSGGTPRISASSNNDAFKVAGGGATTINWGTPGQITISSTNTTYSGSATINVVGTSIQLSHLGLESLSNPGAVRILYNTGSASAWLSIDSTLQIASGVLSVVGGGGGGNVTSLSFNASTGVITLNQSAGTSPLTVDIDNRYFGNISISQPITGSVDVAYNDPNGTFKDNIRWTGGNCISLVRNSDGEITINAEEPSDRRLKRRIRPYTKNASRLVGSLPVYEFQQKQGSRWRNRVGWMADEARKIPGAVYINSAKFLVLRDREMLATLWKAHQELQIEVKELKNKIK